MARNVRNVNPSLSSDARDKLLAALNWPVGKLKGAEYAKAPMYFDACREWHERLSEDDRELVLTLADCHGQCTQGRCRVHGWHAAASATVPTVIDDRDVWQAALLLVRRYGDDAMLEAAERADQMLEEGDMAGAETWHRILNAIERLRRRSRQRARRCSDPLNGRCGRPLS